MLDFQTKFKRQIEILGLCNTKHTEGIKDYLLDEYNIEPLTIQRDLQSLRANGIEIHSSGKRGIELTGKIRQNTLKELLIQYLGICYTNKTFDKPTALMVKKLKEKALSNVVILQRCIEKREKASMLYEKESGEGGTRQTDICPLQIYQSDNFMRLLAKENDKIMQFNLNKIIDLKPTGRKFKPVQQREIDELFLYSWGVRIGHKKYKVWLRISGKLAAQIKPRQVMIYQEIRDNSDGSIDMLITVNSLTEIARWIAGRGDEITVLEPKELKEKVFGIATRVLSNYGIYLVC